MDTYSKLYSKHSYLNRDIDCLMSTYVREYDMTSAGFNILIKYKLLPDMTLEYLSKLNKVERNIEIGWMMKGDGELIRKLNDGFTESRRLFFEANNIQDDDVLSIKKDAIYLVKKIADYTEFDDIKFIEKNTYTSYYYLNDNEFYFRNYGKILDVKGINDIKLEPHDEYMIDELKYIFTLAEQADKKRVIQRIRQFSEKYLNMKLDIGYYRELNQSSLFRLNKKFYKDAVGVDHIEYDDINDININYNYIHYIIPLVNLFF